MDDQTAPGQAQPAPAKQGQGGPAPSGPPTIKPVPSPTPPPHPAKQDTRHAGPPPLVGKPKVPSFPSGGKPGVPSSPSGGKPGVPSSPSGGKPGVPPPSSGGKPGDLSPVGKLPDPSPPSPPPPDAPKPEPEPKPAVPSETSAPSTEGPKPVPSPTPGKPASAVSEDKPPLQYAAPVAMSSPSRVERAVPSVAKGPSLPSSAPPTQPPKTLSFGTDKKGPGGPARLRRILTILSVVVIVALIGFLGFSLFRGGLHNLPLIGGLFPSPHRDIELTYWGLWESSDLMEPVLNDFIAAYTNEHSNVSLTINYEKRSFGTLEQYKETISTRLRQGTGPDVIRIHNSWIEDLAEELSSLPDSVMSSSDYQAAFYPVVVTSAKVEDQTYAIPLMYDGLVLYYNEELFGEEDAAAALSTWEGFRREAVRMTTWVEDDPEEAILQAGAAFGAANNISHATDLLSLLLVQSGVSLLTELETQPAADALSFYTNFVLEDHIWDETLPYSINAFANGQVAMVFGPSWRALDIRNLNPQLQFAAVPVPQLPDAPEAGVHWATFWVEAVNKDSENAEVAWELLKFLSEEDQQRKFFSEASKGRYFGEPYSRSSLATALADHEILEPLLAGAGTAVSGKTTDQSGNKSYVDAFKQAISNVLGAEAANAAFETAQATINQLEGIASPSEE